jgi:hypothetical protein
MAKESQNETEQRLKAFFRDTMLSEPGMTGEKAEQLAARCVQSIDTVLTKRGGTIPAAIAAAPVPAPQPSGFDPFAFSAVSVLARKGRDALIARLGEITSPENLREFAIAQHIAIDQTLSHADELRLAIVKGTERRIAARRAAAS